MKISYFNKNSCQSDI